MGVISTGSIFKTLTFDGKSSAEFNVYITGEGVFNAPERAVEMISIPGRNGAFALDNGRFENIEVTYNCGIAGDDDTDFAEAISAFRNWLCSRNGYVRLTDDYNANEYRMAVYKSGLEVAATQLIAGEFPIVFECKPQRFLTSGEEKISVGEWGETTTETGDIVEIENPDGILSVKSLTADINAEQDLNGYSFPWIHDDNEQTPYLFRSSNTVAEVGNSIFDTLVGGTLAVNQLANIHVIDVSKTENGVTITDNRDGTYTVYTDAGGATGNLYIAVPAVQVTAGHRYFFRSLTTAGNTNTYYAYVTTNVVQPYDYGTPTIGYASTSGNAYIVPIYVKTGTVITTPIKVKPQYIDLTQTFGTTIADYVYNLEQSTAGSGVAWLKQYYPSIFNSYQPYNAGSLESVEASEHRMTGFNQWDITTDNIGQTIRADGTLSSNANFTTSDYIKVLPSATYYFKDVAPSANALTIAEYDINKNFIKTQSVSGASGTNASGTKVMGDNTHFIRVQRWTSCDTSCVNISSSRNGEYEPYTQTSYPLDSDLVLRGIPKLDNGVPYYDGDTYASGGTVTRKYGIVDLGALNWNLSSNENYFYSNGLPSSAKVVTRNIINSKGYGLTTYANGIDLYNGTSDKVLGVALSSISSSTVAVYVRDTAYTTTAAFKTAMSGVYLIYELATPTTETADPFTNPQVVYADGTEEYVTNNVVPVGHITDHANICPITGHDTVNVVVSPTTEAGDGTTYTTALGATVYGGTLDVVSGELAIDRAFVDFGSLTWTNYKNGGFRAALSGSVPATLSTDDSRLITSMYRTYASSATLTNGMASIVGGSLHAVNSNYTTDANAFKNGMSGQTAVYKLETPTTTTLTAQQVELLLGANNIWADTGNVAVEFGQNPNILVNPTLFESRPMLEVTGSGAVNLNDDTIQINNDPIGDVVIFEQQTKNTASAWPVYIETQYANTGDPIIVTECQYTVNWTLSRGLISDITYTTTGDGHAAVYDVGAGMKPAVWLEGVEFAFGTASTITTTATFTIVTTYYGTLTADITLSLAYDGASQLILSHTATRPTQFSSASPRKTIGDVILRSSQIALGNPIYIDLNIGEAYKIENDVPVSVNNGVVIPAELPTLAPGANMITCDNTITQLDIVPRWWKI